MRKILQKKNKINKTDFVCVCVKATFSRNMFFKPRRII